MPGPPTPRATRDARFGHPSSYADRSSCRCPRTEPTTKSRNARCPYQKSHPSCRRPRDQVILRLLGALLLTPAHSSRAAREAEILFLRQQLLVLKRSGAVRPRLRNTDRLIFVWLYRLFPSLLDAAVIFKPETLVRWHRGGVRLFWRWKSRRPSGRPAMPAGIRSRRSIQSVGRIVRVRVLGGLHYHYVRMA